MQYLNNNSGNKFIASAIEKNEKLSICRLGIVELNSIFHIRRYKSIPNNLVYLLQNNAGVYGDSIEDFAFEYISNIPLCNVHIFWNDPNLLLQQQYLYPSLCPNSTKIEHRSVEPFYFDDPWSKHLEGKKILVVSPFAESIIYQYEHRTKLWDNPLILPYFNLITYKNIQSINNNGPHSGWLESLNIMKNDISNYEFDIALLGCGAYGLPLVSFIANTMNKTAIYIGGALQILFGIKGKRWDHHEDISKMYKESWIRPSNKETPLLSNNIENGCYW